MTHSFLSFLRQATSPYHVVSESCRILEKNGFQKLAFDADWNLKLGLSYYTVLYGTTMFAFTIGENTGKLPIFKMEAAHTDHPCFRIKPHPEHPNHHYIRLNTEPYGGMIHSTWLDRPLSIAGKVALKSNRIFEPIQTQVDFKKPLLTIPGLAIHMNPSTNKGCEFNPQTQLLPVIGTSSASKDFCFSSLLAEELHTTADDILDYDLYVYNAEDGCLLGTDGELLSAPRLDNLTSVYACIQAIINQKNKKDISIICLYDNEEVGSHTKQGADSVNTTILLEKIYAALGFSHLDFCNTLYKSYFLSVDVSHGFHPNYPDKNDPTNVTQLNDGIIFKINGSQKYTTDSQMTAIMQQLCMQYDIPYQKYVNHSNIRGGSTLGALLSARLPMLSADIGVPVLSMHSARELMGTKDEAALTQFLTHFLSE